MNSTEAENLITSYVLGDLDTDESSQVETLLTSCETARSVKSDTEATLALLGEAFTDEHLLAEKGLAPEAVPVTRSPRRQEPIRIPVRIWAHAAGIVVFFGFTYVLFQAMLPLVQDRTETNSFRVRSAPAAAAPSAAVPEGQAGTDPAWKDFKTGRLRLVEGFSAAPEDGYMVLKKDGVFIKMSTGITSGMVMTPERDMDWVREQRTGDRRWILGASETAEGFNYLLTLVPANGDFAVNSTAWPANFSMTAIDRPAALAELLLMAASYQPAPSEERARVLVIDRDIAGVVVASGDVLAIARTPDGLVLKTRDGFDYVAADLSVEDASTLAESAPNPITLER